MSIDVTDHLGLAWTVAGAFQRRWFGYSRPLEDSDLLSEAYVALMFAAKNFDESKGYAFSTYASKAIKQRLYDWAITGERPLQLPKSATLSAIKLHCFRRDHGRYPTRDETADLMRRPGIKQSTHASYIRAARLYSASTSSLPNDDVLERTDEDD